MILDTINNITIHFIINLALIFIAYIIALILIINEDEPEELIIIYQNKKKKFKSINQIKKDVGAQAFETVTQFETNPEKIIKSLYPNCKIIKNTLL